MDLDEGGRGQRPARGGIPVWIPAPPCRSMRPWQVSNGSGRRRPRAKTRPWGDPRMDSSAALPVNETMAGVKWIWTKEAEGKDPPVGDRPYGFQRRLAGQ